VIEKCGWTFDPLAAARLLYMAEGRGQQGKPPSPCGHAALTSLAQSLAGDNEIRLAVFGSRAENRRSFANAGIS